jgi:translation elongation factor EF-1alpha
MLNLLLSHWSRILTFSSYSARCLTKNMSAVVEIELSAPVCLELYRDCRDLGRFMLRHAGATIAAGLVTEVSRF